MIASDGIIEPPEFLEYKPEVIVHPGIFRFDGKSILVAADSLTKPSDFT